MLVMKVSALVEFRKARDTTHIAARANRCAEIVRPITTQTLQFHSQRYELTLTYHL